MTLFEFSATHTQELLGNIVDLVDDVKIFFLLVFALFLGFHILEFIFKSVLRKD